MAKKKSGGDDSTIDIGQRILDEVTKEFGDVIINGESILDVPRELVSICPTIDYALGGGVTKGSWFVLNGKPKQGKTQLALKLLAGCQRNGMETYVDNVEHRLKERDISGVEGLDASKVHIIQSTKEKILSAEDHLCILDKLLSTKENCAVVVDSFSALAEASKFAEFNKKTRGELGQIVTAFCDRMCSVVPLRNHIIIGITHVIANTGGQGMSPTVEKTSARLVFQSDFKMKVKWAPAWKDGEEQIGQTPHWICEFSGLRGPGREVVSYLRYGIGYDDTMEYIKFAEEFGLIAKGGAWYTLFPDDKAENPIKMQGAERLWEFLRNPDNKEHYHRLVKEVRELLGLPAITLE
jgi:recombination protein RecA